MVIFKAKDYVAELDLIIKNKFEKLETDKLTLENFGRELQAIIPESPYLKITKEVDRLIIEPSAKFPYDKEGLIIKELNIESIHFLKQKYRQVRVFGRY